MRYLKNKKLISEKDQERLGKSKVVVLGCGGLGGYVVEMLTRVGVGKLTLIDFDKFDESNLNRQLLSTEKNIGEFKVEVAGERVQEVNSNVLIECINKKITKENLVELVSKGDIVVDALDDSILKKDVEKVCKAAGIPMVHGAIGGFVGQVAVIMPGDDILEKIYGDSKLENPMGNPSFTPGLVASIQVGEVIKVLLDKGKVLNNEVLYIDLEENIFRKLKI